MYISGVETIDYLLNTYVNAEFNAKVVEMIRSSIASGQEYTNYEEFLSTVRSFHRLFSLFLLLAFPSCINHDDHYPVFTCKDFEKIANVFVLMYILNRYLLRRFSVYILEQ